MAVFIGGDETLVNTYTIDYQVNSAVTTLTSGGWVVIWTSFEQDGSDYGVYSQAYNDDGTKNGAETRVNTATDRAQTEPSVAALLDGGWVITWSSDVQNGAKFGIISQRFNADGTRNGDETAVSTPTAGSQLQSNVTALNDGGWVVTWTSGNAKDGSGYGIYSQVYEADGTKSGGETLVNTSTAGDQVAPATTALSNGGWVVTWASSDGEDGSTRDVFAQAFNADGTKNGGQTLVNTTTTHNEDLPAIAALGDGGWVVTWTSTATTGSGVGVFAQVYNADGTKDGGEISVSSSFSGGGNSISVAALSDGGWVAAWSSVGEGDATTDIYTQAFDASGVKIGDAVLVNTYTTNDQVHPSVTGIAYGGYVVTWTSYNQDGSADGIYSRTFEHPTGSAPVGTDRTISLREDGSYSFLPSDFGFIDDDGDAQESVQIISLPANGTLALDGVAVATGQKIATADITKLVWVPAADVSGNGVSSFTFKVRDDTGRTSETANTITFDVAPEKDAPTGTSVMINLLEDGDFHFQLSDFGFVDADGDTLASVNIVSLPAKGTFALNGVAVTAGQDIAASDIDAGLLSWTPPANEHGAVYGDIFASFTFKVKDSTGLTSVSANTIDFNVISAADAPTAANKTVSLNEDSRYTFKVSDFGYADVDGDALASVQIISLPANGSLTLNGVTVTANQSIAAADLTKLAWAPASNANGNGLASFTFKVKETSASGLVSKSANTITFNVAAVNDAPTAANKTVSLNEDASYTFKASDFGFADVLDGDTLASVQIVSLPATGSLKLNGVAVTANQNITAADLTKLAWTPAANANGNGMASFTFKVKDSGGLSSVSANTITFNVAAVDDAPTGADKTVTLVEDGAYTFTASDFGFADADGDKMSAVKISTLPTGALKLNGVAVTAGQEIKAADIGKLVWTPAANVNGATVASLTFQVRDDGQIDATPNKITFSVTPVSDAPTGADKTVTMKEDMPYTFSASNFGFSDVDGDDLSAVKISTLPTGALKLNGVTVVAGQEIKVADIGKLVWTPAANANGDKLSSFTFQVIDDSKVTVKETSTSTIVSGFKVTGGAGTIEVKAPNIVKDQTSFIMVQNVAGANAAFETVAAGQPDAVAVSGAQYTLSFDKLSVIGWPDAPGKVTIYVGTTQIGTKTLPTSNVANSQEVTLTTSAIAAADAGKAIRIVWSSTGGGNGNAIAIDNVELFKVGGDGKNLIKNGDFGSGNYSTGANIDLTPNKITFDVDPVNDAPSGADKTVTLLEDGKYTFASSDFGFTDPDGNALLGVKISTLPANGKLTLNGVALTSGQQIAAADIGKLVWTPAANANGDKLATLKFQVIDNGGTANGGINTDQSPHTITFNVIAVNEPPSGVDKTVTIAEDVSYKFAASDFGFSDPDGGTLSGVKITTLPSDGSLTLAGVAVKAGAIIAAADILKLAWTPDEDDAGKALGKFTFQVISTGTGVTMDAAPNTFTINVNEETDLFRGTSKANTIVGTAFADWIDGKAGNDTLTGKGGADTFFFGTGYDRDTITDFVATGSAHDVLDLSGALSITSFADLKANHMVAKGSDVWIDAGQDDVVILKGVKLADLDAGDFMF